VQQYVAFAAGGQLEDIAARELECTFGLRCGSVQSVALPPLSDQWAPENRERVFAGQAGVAKLLFALPRPADAAGWSRQRRLFASLKCTQGVVALVCVESGLPFEKEAAQGFLADVIARAEGWGSALVAWWHLLGPGWRERADSGHTDTSSCPAFPECVPCLRFRGSSIRDGQHQYKSVDMTPAVGSGTLSRFPGWRVDLRTFDIEVLAVALQHELVVGVSLSSAPRGAATSCLPAEPRPLLPCADVRARLRSSTAALMLACAVMEEEGEEEREEEGGGEGDEEGGLGEERDQGGEGGGEDRRDKGSAEESETRFAGGTEGEKGTGAGKGTGGAKDTRSPGATAAGSGSSFETWGSGRRMRRVAHSPAVLVDPMCGVGTIPLEAAATLASDWLRGPAFSDPHRKEDGTVAAGCMKSVSGSAGAGRAGAGWGGVLSLGGDLDPDVLAMAASNAEVLGRALQRTAEARSGLAKLRECGTGGSSGGVGGGAGHVGGRECVLRLDRAAAEVAVSRQGASVGLSLASDGAGLEPLPGWHYAERVHRRGGGAGGGAMGTCVWDATAMPLRSGVADAVVCDPPFGMSHKMRHGAHLIYTLLVAEAARVLRTGGRVVVLTPCRAPLTQALADTAPLWRNVRKSTINCGGTIAVLVVCSRTDAPYHRHWDAEKRRPVHVEPAAPSAGRKGEGA
jgi:hypothetical protein